MGGSSKQTVGYRYFAGLMVSIGNRIETLIAIRPDNIKWIYPNNGEIPHNRDISDMPIYEPELFGGDNKEGGWVGMVDMHVGLPEPQQNKYLAHQIDPDVSAYPNLSYLVFHGADIVTNEKGEQAWKENLDKGFHLVSMSGMMKDFMLWVKRTRVKNDGSVQWYEKNSNGDVVCEIGTLNPVVIHTTVSDNYKQIPSHFLYFSAVINSGFGLTNLELRDDNETNYRLATKTFLENYKSPKYLIESDIYVSTPKKGYRTDKTPFNETTTTAQNITSEIIFWKPSFTGDNEKYALDFYKNGGVVEFSTKKLKHSHFKFVLLKSNIKLSSINFIGGALISKNIEPSLLGDMYHYYLIFFVKPSDDAFGISAKAMPNGEVQLWKVGLEYSWTVNDIDENKSISSIDINPIHKAREIITDKTAMNKPESSVNDANFRAAADRIWDEGLGISWAIQEKSCRDALNEIESHIEGGFRINRQTGLYECILFRDDLLNLDNALKFNESNIKSMNFDIGNIDESVSSINVSYYDRDLIKNSSFVLYENGLEKTRGFSLSENIDFPYFMNRRNAEIVGNWKLKQLSSPMWKGSFTTGLAAARQINKFDVVKISWKSKNIVDLPVRIMNINLGDGVNNAVSLDFVEVIPYSNIDYSQTHTDPAPPLDTGIAKPSVNTAFEMPYFESVQRFGQTQVDNELANTPEIGYLMASALKPQNNSVNAHLYTDGGSNNFAQMSYASIVDYCPAVELNQEIGYLDTSFVVKNINDSRFTGATVGTWVILNDEIMVFESFNNDTMTITVKRGALDTVPQKHTGGIIFFSDEFSGFDATQYILGENVAYQVLTTTPSEIEKLDEAKSKHVIFKSRAIRPYPPANVKINGEYYPAKIESDLVLTWANRNRLQQTGGVLLGWYESSVTLESNVEYILELYDANNVLTYKKNLGAVDNTIVDYSSITTESCKIRLYSVRDGINSFKVFEHLILIVSIVDKASSINAEYLSDTLVPASSFKKIYDENNIDKPTSFRLEYFNE